jgi:polyferredoxin
MSGRKSCPQGCIVEVIEEQPFGDLTFVQFEEQRKRFDDLQKKWSPDEKIRRLLGWMGVERLTLMNDWYETEDYS